jgi:hypothetical protein
MQGKLPNPAPEADLSPQPKSGIIWLASFPKSGNTWTRTFLHNLTQILQVGEAEEQDINAMGRFSAWEIMKKRYKDILGFDPTDEHRREIAAVRHKVQQQMANEGEGMLFVKTHHALVMDRGYTTINTAVTSGAVYIVRNPLDVAISYSHHISKSIDEAISLMAVENAETPLSEKSVYEVYGSWSQHVWSWTRTPHRAIYVMRYEDMLRDPEKYFGELARHLLFNPDAAQLKQAIELSSFEKLKKQEEAKGFNEKPKNAQSFFRDGRSGQWQTVLSEEQIRRVINDHGEQMKRFGYITSDGKPLLG